ncbi:glucan endo-1,3-beta-glucosidase, acidic isoform-like [Camellia sinensis]|uniref:glucan endo-1,3-beta-glucosidase, acidic isoform-like n=1 Tax=Camellia sinensis TaxID=4442 RepID=UPI00103658FC|nr:glucan endo-1,3-beta-glucosidase, acidic isoform-like [Camellia sinensis]
MAAMKFNLEKSIKISSPIALSALQTSYPSSSGLFKPDLIEPAIKPISFCEFQRMAKLNLSPSLSLPLLFSLCYFFPIASSFSDTGSIGVNYGRIADNLPPPSPVVQLLKSQGLNQVKLYDSDPAVLTALSGSGISVTVALPNELLSSASSSQSFTDKWVQTNIIPNRVGARDSSRC